jgi:HAD superfamily hydrolase (TIGR01484 family)
LETTNYIINDIRSVSETQELTIATEKEVLWNSPHITESPILYKAIYNDFSKPLDNCAYKIVAELPNKETALNIANKYSDCKVICYRGENRYGFINKNAGKVQAIRALASYLNIGLSNIIAFGDDLNDIEMLEQCGYGIAVSNAVEEVLNVADYVTDSNDEDGVAKFIEKNIFINK